ncbi:hypothetical protein BV25DRAFT_140206 [Artomyces pyxidatus]|uniref:Uncharacterized protein n=1 Tax=Artomyces pyxidatus TaxID=48021 RepID=A0ACB8TAF6_9AGAM|nr:hypothetical protein BV25DRAFT_140206 [Artomyces pyxidatus]
MPGWETSKPPPLPERRVGLGFNLLEDKEENTRQGIQPRFHDHQSLNDEDGAESLYDDDDDDDDEEREEREDDEEMTTEGSLAEASDESTAYLQSLIQSRHVRFEQSGDERGRSSSSLPNPWDRDYMNGGHQSRRNEPSLPDGHLRHEESERRRRDALLGIVNELENGAYSGDQYTESDEPSDSEYTGQQGLAISPSTEFADRAYGGRGSSLYFSPRARAGSGPGPPPPRDAPQPSPRQYERSVNHRRAPDEPSSDDVDSPSASEYTDDDNRDERFNDDRTPRLSSSKRQFQDAARSRDIPRARYSRDPSNASGSQHYPSPGIVIHPPSRPTSETILSEGSSYLAAGSHIQEHARDQRPPPSRSPVVQGQSKSFSTAIPKPRSIETPAQGTQMPGTRRRSRHGESTNRTSKDHFVSETYSLHENLGLAEAREREAFGLPLSSPESDRRLPQLDSASSIASGRWQDGEEEISLGAEAIFEQLASRRNATGMRNPGTIGVSRGPSKQASERTQYRSDATGPPPSHSQQTGVSETSSTYSIYQEEVPSRPWQQRERDAHVLEASETRTWRSTLSSSAYRSLLERYGETEMQRQEVIWEISEAEQTFVKRLRTIVHLFILPLRMKDSVTWLDGVPTEAARLFDWLEDIINLHSQISSSLRATISGQYPMVTRVAEVIRSFIPRLEVHQPYLVRVEEVALLIERMTREPGNDFGEFIRIQQEQDECRGWNIETFLVEPVNRLVEYPASFRRLWELTPRSHLDHLSTFSLLHSTETMIRVMREVKIREEEYELVKDRLGRIQGLPSSIPIASRERRLLARGRLLREYTNEYLRGIGNTEVPGHQLGDQYLRPPGGSTRAAERMSSRQSKLITALQSRNGTSLRSGSTRSTASSMFSADTHLTTSSSTTPPITPVSPPQYDNFMAPKSPWDDRYTTPQSTLVNMRRTETLRQSLLHTLVFSDLIILASSVRDTSRPGEANTSLDSWRLLEDVGISRILGVSGDADKIVLDLLPMDISDLDSGIIPESAPVTSIAISIPQVSSSGERLQAAAMADIRRMWVSAFQQCSQHTLRALSFPTQSGKYLARGPNVDWEEDSRQSVMAILASGLPLPKSPSLQLQEVVRGRGGDDIQQEREERGWWSLRFQQVLRELQRASDISANARNALSLGGSNGEGPRKRPGVSHPRPLRLSSLSSSESLAREEHPRPNTRN